MTTEQAEKILDDAIKGHHSTEWEYELDNYGYMKYPAKVTKMSYKYLEIGDNIELDGYGFLLSSRYLYAYPHLRNTEKVDKYFLANVVKRIAIYTKTKILEFMDQMNRVNYLEPSLQVSWQDLIDSMPEDLLFKVPMTSVDPGFTNHRHDEERTTGLRVGSLVLKYPDIFDPSYDNLVNGEMKLKNVLINPDHYRERLRVYDVSPVNEELMKVSSHKNSIKKLQIKAKILLEKPGEITFPQFDRHDDETDTWVIFGPMVVHYDFIGNLPVMKYHISIASEDDPKKYFSGELTQSTQDYNKTGWFEVHFPKKIMEVLPEHMVEELKRNDLPQKFQKEINKVFRKHQLNISFYYIKVKVLYDTDESVEITTQKTNT